MALMTAVLKTEPKPGIQVKKIEVPEPQKEEALVKVKCSSICGTDIGIYDWGDWAKSHVIPPKVIGHEVVGEIVSINSTAKTLLKVGDIVSSETHIYCDHCSQCLAGNKHICENLELFGISRNGGFAQYTTIPLRTAWKNDPTLPIEIMSIQEPLGNAVHVLEQAQVHGKRVLLLGLGPVGLCAGIIAKLYGAQEIVAIEKSPYRRELAHKLGIHYVYEKMESTLAQNFDIVLEMSGDPELIVAGFNHIRQAGVYIAFGIPKHPVTLSWGEALINKEVTIKSVFGRKIWDTWHEVQNILKNPKVNFMPLITHKYHLEEIEEAVTQMKKGQCGKIILYPQG